MIPGYSGFLAAPAADLMGRKAAMALGTVLIMIGALLETFTRRHALGMFIAGRAVVGLGQGIALCEYARLRRILAFGVY